MISRSYSTAWSSPIIQFHPALVVIWVLRGWSRTGLPFYPNPRYLTCRSGQPKINLIRAILRSLFCRGYLSLFATLVVRFAIIADRSLSGIVQWKHFFVSLKSWCPREQKDVRDELFSIISKWQRQRERRGNGEKVT